MPAPAPASPTEPGFFLRLLLFPVLLLLLASCREGQLDPERPVTLTFWHVYGAQTASPMNPLIERFNQTEGREKGVRISVTAVSNSTAIHDSLVAAARGFPGAGEVPELFVCYPKTIRAMGTGKALDWKEVLGKEELAAIHAPFLEEGMADGRLVLFPVAKSTNALFINCALFEPFALQNHVSYTDLATWEGVFACAEKYHAWSHGLPFFKYDDWIFYPLLNMRALGEEFLDASGRIRFESPLFKKLWSNLARGAILGHVSLVPGYSTKAMMTGRAVMGVESTASVLYFKDRVTWPDNTQTPLTVKVLPEPRFLGAKRLDIQRGAMLGAWQLTPAQKAAAAVFVRWLTQSDVNVPFALAGGYLPVRTADLGKLEAEGPKEPLPGYRWKAMYQAILPLMKTTEFCTQPSDAGYGDLERRYVEAMRAVLTESRRKWVKHGAKLDELVETSFRELGRRMAEGMPEAPGIAGSAVPAGSAGTSGSADSAGSAGSAGSASSAGANGVATPDGGAPRP